MTSHKLRGVLLAGAVLMTSGGLFAVAPAHAAWNDHNDRQWRDHVRHEARDHVRGDSWRRHWDHAYWDRDRYYNRDVYVYRPPPAVYEPAPPPGIGFAFQVND